MNQTGSHHEVGQTPVCTLRTSKTVSLTITGDHVDILGRSSLNDLILRIAGGKGDHIEDHFVSNIREYAANVKIFEEESNVT